MKKLIIIDDEQMDLDILKNCFSSYFDEIICTNDPYLYLNQINNLEYDLIIINKNMPKISGIDLLNKINISKYEAFPPIIFTSADEIESAQEYVFDYGVTDYFIKPYNIKNVYFRGIRAVSNYYKNKDIYSMHQIVKNSMQNMIENPNSIEVSLGIISSLHNFFETSRAVSYRFINDKFVKKFEWPLNDKFIDEIGEISLLGYDYNKLKNEQIIEVEPSQVKAFNEYFNFKIKSIFAVPLVSNQEVIGFMTLENYNKEKFNHTINIMNTLICVYNGFINQDEFKETKEFDSVTGLYNKDKFKREVIKTLESSNQKFASIMFDISGFSSINAMFGFGEGDNILASIGRFLSSNKGIVTASRIENDIFCVLLKLKDNNLTYPYLEIEKYLNNNTKLNNALINYGIYIIEDNKEDYDAIYTKTSIAHKINREDKINNYTFYNAKYNEKFIWRQKILESFNNAIKNEDIKLYIQPQFDLKKNSFYAGEVLSRWLWNDTLLSPATFIPILEETGEIMKLDHYVLDMTLKNIRKWLDDGYLVMPMSINISSIHLKDSDLSFEIINQIDKYNVPHNLIEIEITETAFVENQENVIKVVKELTDANINVLMDDFGSGYSSLNTLKDLDISILKLDYKFIEPSNNKLKQEIIIKNVVNMANELNLPIIVEGVEEKEQLDLVNRHGINYIQGYYFSKPITINEYEKLLKKGINHEK